MDVSGVPAQQVDAFLRSVARRAEATASSLARAEERLRRETPEAVAGCQAALDELLPATLAAATCSGLLARVTAAVAAHDQELPGKHAALAASVGTLYEAQEAELAASSAAQRARHAAELAAARAAHNARPKQLSPPPLDFAREGRSEELAERPRLGRSPVPADALG